ncbi:MAG: GGDEF domain-containing protein [Elusimicrobiota bacterium]
MTTDRRQTDLEADGEGGPLERIPHQVLFPAIGLLLAFFSPLSAFLLRLWQADPVLVSLWIRSELTYNSLFYVYTTISTALIFMTLGAVLGIKSESQRVHNKTLRSRMAELQIRSVTDGLTGAYSHAYLQEMLSIEIDRSRRTGRPLSVVMMDIDDFKKINDMHGHLFGDQVLKEVTEAVSMNIRQHDVLGRYGGEEFLVIMPGTEPDVAAKVAGRVCRAVARAWVRDKREAPGAALVRVTLSGGVATFPGTGSATPTALIEAADRRLYAAKREGKNRVCA